MGVRYPESGYQAERSWIPAAGAAGVPLGDGGSFGRFHGLLSDDVARVASELSLCLAVFLAGRAIQRFFCLREQVPPVSSSSVFYDWISVYLPRADGADLSSFFPAWRHGRPLRFFDGLELGFCNSGGVLRQGFDEAWTFRKSRDCDGGDFPVVIVAGTGIVRPGEC